MKLLCAEYTPEGGYGFVTLGDNTLLRNNDDFYIPDYISKLSCVPQLVFRVCKIGKSISPRFASRYVDEVGVGLRFYADDLVQELRGKGLPDGAGIGFDHAAVISPLKKMEGGVCNYSFMLNGQERFSGDLSGLPLSLEALISGMSAFYMFKIGDFLYCGNSFRYTGLQPGDRLQMQLNGELLLDFFIR